MFMNFNFFFFFPKFGKVLLHYPHPPSQISESTLLVIKEMIVNPASDIFFINLTREAFLSKPYTLYQFCLKKANNDEAHLLLNFISLLHTCHVQTQSKK